MPRNFIQNKADVTQYYVNRAKKEEERNQFKLVDTRRVKVPARNGKSTNKADTSNERRVQHENTSPTPSTVPTPQPSKSQSSTPSPSNSQVPITPDYRFLLAWSYYVASQAALLSPMLQQQQGRTPFTLTNDPAAASRFLQAMETAMNPLAAKQTLNNNKNNEPTKNELDFDTNNHSAIIKNEPDES